MAVAIVNPKNLVYARPKGFTDTPTHYCPGCTHGTAHRLVAEVLEEMNLLDKTIGVAPVGCAVFAYNYIDVDFVEAAHGRPGDGHRHQACPAGAGRFRLPGRW